MNIITFFYITKYLNFKSNTERTGIYCIWITFDCVRNTQSTYEYRAPLVHTEPIAQLEAVDTPPKKEPYLPTGKAFSLGSTTTMSKEVKVLVSPVVTVAK